MPSAFSTEIFSADTFTIISVPSDAPRAGCKEEMLVSIPAKPRGVFLPQITDSLREMS